MAGVAPKFEHWCESGSPTEFVISLNLHRRHLTASQKAAIATEALPMFEAEAEEERRKKISASRKAETSQKIDSSGIDPKARLGFEMGLALGRSTEADKNAVRAAAKAAKATGANRQYVSDAKAIKAASPETFEKVLAGEVSIPKAKN